MPLTVGEMFETTSRSGGQSIFWGSGLKPIDGDGKPIDAAPRKVGDPRQIDDHTTQVLLAYPEGTRLKGVGNFKLDFLLYKLAGMDLQKQNTGMLDTLELPFKIVTPFLVMIVVSLVTPRNSKEALDRYYAKMKTPVVPDHDQDAKNLKAAYADPASTESKKLFPGSSLEFSRPTATDIIGFIVCVLICFAVVGFAVWMANIGA